MEKKRLTNSTRKFIRQEKARIRREVLDSEKRKELIQQLYTKFDKSVSDEKEILVPKKKRIAKSTKVTKDKTIKTKIDKTKKVVLKKK
jgi:hypothetical protein